MLAVNGSRRAARFFGVLLGATAVLASAGCSPEETQASHASADAKGPRIVAKSTSGGAGPRFDFYVLALSWSPSYCESEGEGASGQQCRSGRPYSFVVHGLWPQFEKGFPQDCDTTEPDVPRETLAELYDLMPSAGLIRHEWRTHGTCTGLDQKDYFTVLRAARERVAVPEEFRKLDNYRTLEPEKVEQSFLTSNPMLKQDALAVTCDNRYLRDVRICMTKELEFRACPEVDRRMCDLPQVVMPPVRGG